MGDLRPGVLQRLRDEGATNLVVVARVEETPRELNEVLSSLIRLEDDMIAGTDWRVQLFQLGR